jgi:transcriptional regulator with XRE-family HTH domain
MDRLNEALRLTRVFHDMTQTELAGRLGVSKSFLSEVESGKKAVRLEMLDRYADVFGVPASALLLFSENLAERGFAERARGLVAEKIITMMKWIEAKDLPDRNETKT